MEGRGGGRGRGCERPSSQRVPYALLVNPHRLHRRVIDSRFNRSRLPATMKYGTEKEYLMGWLACDGCLEANQITVSLQLQKRDESVLHLFKRVFNARLDGQERELKGRLYVRARIHDKRLWEFLHALYGGRLKSDKKFPGGATTAFVVGCLDADGSFYKKHGYIVGEFQHASPAFREGLKNWLEQVGIPVGLHGQVPRLLFWNRACLKLLSLYQQVPCVLQRKLAALSDRPTPHSRWWTAAQLEVLRVNPTANHAQLASLTGKSEKAVNIKLFRLRHTA